MKTAPYFPITYSVFLIGLERYNVMELYSLSLDIRLDPTHPIRRTSKKLNWEPNIAAKTFKKAVLPAKMGRNVGDIINPKRASKESINVIPEIPKVINLKIPITKIATRAKINNFTILEPSAVFASTNAIVRTL
jgi:hypothetical protein